MEEHVMIVLDAQELMELERILVDREREDALRFLQEIQRKVERARQTRCKPPNG